MWTVDYGNGHRSRHVFRYFREAQAWAASERAILRNPSVRVVRVES